VQRLTDLADLRESLLAAGLDVSFDIDPAARTLPAAVDATCFRVVQEALTNTLRHAGSTAARVRVARTDDRVLLEVLDDGGTPSGTLRDSGAGHGLTGMRERVAALGGTLDAGPREGGGWRVAASLPVVQSDASPARLDAGVPTP
jgi:signal transduction histidine kinase